MENNEIHNIGDSETEEPSIQTHRRKLISVLVIGAILVCVLLFLLLTQGSSDIMPDVANQSEQNLNSSTEEQVTFTPSLFVIDGRELQYVDENLELTHYATLKENERVVEVLKTEGAPSVRYVVEEEKVDSFKILKSYGEIINGEKKVLIEFSEDINGRYEHTPVVSPDRSKLFVEKVAEDNFIFNFIVIDIQTGEENIIYSPNTDTFVDRALKFVSWDGNDAVILNRERRRVGHGPFDNPELVRFDLNTKTIADFANFQPAVSEELDHAVFQSNTETIYAFSGDYTQIWFGQPSANYDPDYLFQVDKSDGQLKQLYKWTNSLVSIVGASASNKELYLQELTVRTTTEDDPLKFTAESEPIDSSDRFVAWNPPKLVKISEDGVSKEISIDSRLIRDRSRIVDVVDYDRGILLYVYTDTLYITEDTGQPTTAALIYLPLEQEDNETKTIFEKTATEDVTYNRKLYKAKST